MTIKLIEYVWMPGQCKLGLHYFSHQSWVHREGNFEISYILPQIPYIILIRTNFAHGQILPLTGNDKFQKVMAFEGGVEG